MDEGVVSENVAMETPVVDTGAALSDTLIPCVGSEVSFSIIVVIPILSVIDVGTTRVVERDGISVSDVIIPDDENGGVPMYVVAADCRRVIRSEWMIVVAGREVEIPSLRTI